MRGEPTIVWFRNDLRLADQPALNAAVRRGGAVIPVFVWAPDEEGTWPPGAASRWWLHHSLAALAESLEKKGSRLILAAGPTQQALEKLVRQTGATAVFWSRRYEPAARERDERIEKNLRALNIDVETFNASLLFEPHDVATKKDKPFQTFTPFWKACCSLDEPSKPLPAPKDLHAPDKWPASKTLKSLALLPKIDWAAGMREACTPGEQGAQHALHEFLSDALQAYEPDRDRPDRAGSSRLSPHLHFGELSPRQAWHTVRTKRQHSRGAETAASAETYLRELGWREFAHHLLYHFPQTTDAPLREQFGRFPWQKDAASLHAWQRGLTGFPIVDAGMRQLWSTGWMHNRVRMLVASFLVKDLLISWQSGARWFWDTLVDADLANNTLGWQWTAGCGADAAPYFRIFNPIAQAERFDPEGVYIRRWVPELAKMPARWIHDPAAAPAEVLKKAGVVLGRTYPRPIVDHAAARARALEAFKQMRTPSA
jgi:deoxyribodipyrimidine photo-lyase